VCACARACTHTHTHRDTVAYVRDMPVKTSVIILKKVRSESERSIYEDRMYPMSVRNKL